MSLGMVVKGPEGLVLAAESRLTLTSQVPNGPQFHVNFDNATKLLSFSPPNTAVGVVTYGAAAIGSRTAYSFIPEFEAGLPAERLPIQQFSETLSAFFLQQWQSSVPAGQGGPGMTFVVGGFNEGEPYGRVFLFEVPSKPVPQEQNQGPGEFGISWGGQRDVVDRLIQGFDHRLPELVTKTLKLSPDRAATLKATLAPLQMAIPLAAMPLQDCVDLAIFFIRTTISAQRLTVGLRGCGGAIDVATITRREGLQFIQRKTVTGEIGTYTPVLERRI